MKDETSPPFFILHPSSFILSLVLVHLLDGLTQSGHYPTLGEVHGPHGHPQRGGHVGPPAAFHRRLPEGLPGGVVEAAAHLVGGPVEEPAFVLLVPDGLVLRAGRLLLQPRLHSAVAAAAAGAVPAGPEVV